MNRSIERIAFAAIALLSSTSFYASAMVYTPSSGGVSDLGSASYTVPIQAPPGTAGITPKLAISYSSLGLNGVAGIGWSLSGLSVISRCPKSLATDALVGGVRLDINDRFCLDGTRLVVVPTTATYGADGTEYRTEVESLTKVISHGSAGNGPAWFQVWTREGLIYEYGNTADSQTLSVGSSTARLWAVNKVSDLFGNYYTVTYSQDPVNGSFQPTRIDYTGNVAASLAPYNSIQFAYESRLDGEQWYVGSGLVRQTNRLTNVRTYSGTTLVRDYRLAYETSPNTLRSRLTSVTECAGDETTCMPALTENYVVPSGGLSQAGATIATLNAKNPVVPAAPMKQSNLISATVGDFNGDGIQDVLYVLNYAGMSTTPRAVCYGPTFSTCTSQISMNNSSVEYIGDFDGDGITDRLVWQSDGSMGYCPGPALTTCYTFGYGTSSPYWTFVVGDFDGDGRADLLGWDIRGIGGNYGFLCSITSSSGCKSIQGVSGHGYAVQTGDFDGDGATDLLLISASSYTACSQINTGTNVSSPPCQPVNLPFNTSNANIEVGDFNGDGKADLMFLTTSGVFFCPGPGLLHGYNCSQVPGTSGDWKSAFKPFVGDFDADGRSDLLLTGPSGTQFCSGPVFSQNGACVTVSSQDLSASTILVGDFNGDASSDVFAISATGNQFASGISHIPDLLAGVTNTAFNTATTFTYRPITDTTIHTKGASAGYPIENQALPYLDPAHLLRPFYVASQMTVPNGVGSSNATNYRYESAATELDGRGFTGFTVTHATDVARNRETIRTLSQTFPNMHRVEHRQVFAAGQLASTWKQTFGSTRSCDHNLPIATTIDAVDSSYGLDGVMRSEHLAYSSFDCWGHAKVVSHYQSETSSQLKEAQTLTYQMNLFGQPGQWGVFDRLVESINTFYDQSALNPVTQTDTYTYLNNTNFLQEHV
ncbi:MAG TPA: FG-GAP-like repeat-containing protein, partial [Usitatibacter sp.]|nr:FG-GAP-like repeat-containing protein [Usitatibacter sp.]